VSCHPEVVSTMSGRRPTVPGRREAQIKVLDPLQQIELITFNEHRQIRSGIFIRGVVLDAQVEAGGTRRSVHVHQGTGVNLLKSRLLILAAVGCGGGCQYHQHDERKNNLFHGSIPKLEFVRRLISRNGAWT